MRPRWPPLRSRHIRPAPRWPSRTSGGGRGPTSGSGAPPEVQRHRRTFGKRKAGVSQGSDILTWSAFTDVALFSRGTSQTTALLPRASHHCPSLSYRRRLPEQGMGCLPLSVGTKRKRGRRKLSKPTKAASLAVPFWISSFLDTKRKKIPAGPLTACPSVRRRP